MSEDDLTTFPSPPALMQDLHLREHGYFLVNEVRIVGLVETQPGPKDVALHLRGEESTSQYAVPVFRARDAIDLAKQILHHLEPSALDPDSQIHQSLRRIERHLGIDPND